MKMLAVDQSTAGSSVAVLDGNRVAAERDWADRRSRNQHLFAALRELLDAAGTAPEALDAFAVGTGPGVFSGLRMSISTVRAFALPAGSPVCGVGSATVLAADVLAETGADRAAIVGDARRDRLWVARYTRDGDGVSRDGDIRLVPRGELLPALDGAEVLATPEWDRLAGELTAIERRGMRVLDGSRHPRAATLGRIAAARLRSGALTPPTPVYLHPPVREGIKAHSPR